MIDERSNLKILYNHLYNSLIMSMIQDCLMIFLTSECEMLSDHMESILHASLENEEIIEKYVQNYKQPIDDEGDNQNSFDIAVDYDFYDINNMISLFLTPTRSYIEDIESSENIDYELDTVIDKFRNHIEENLADKYDILIAKSVLQLANMRIALYGKDEKLEALIQGLKKSLYK